jgi:hypothetical protein
VLIGEVLHPLRYAGTTPILGGLAVIAPPQPAKTALAEAVASTASAMWPLAAAGRRSSVSMPSAVSRSANPADPPTLSTSQ